MQRHEALIWPVSKGRPATKLLIALLLLCSSLLPVASGVQDTVLMDGTGIFLTTGESWTFEQGYNLTVKSVNQGTNEAWLELSLNENILREGIFREKGTLVYSREAEILNITVDTIYSSPTGELVTFMPVYQYLDPQLPAPETRENGQDGQSGEHGSQTPVEDDDIFSTPGFGIVWALAGIMLTGFAGYCSRRKNK
jgi:hypothetical protein